MQVAIIAPGRNTDSWHRAFHLLSPEASLVTWPDLSHPEAIELAILWNHPAGILNELPKLRLISSMGAGVDHILKDPLLPRHIPIMRIVDRDLSHAMSNYIIMAVLNYQRNLHQHLANQKDQVWDQQLAYKFSLNIGFLGMGLLASDAAEKLSKLGFAVRGYSRSPKRINRVTTYYGANGWKEFLPELDILINLLPLTDKTHGILDLKLFNQLTKPALLINAARGEHLVESDLLAALDKGLISQAYLDVFEEEPLPPGHLFWAHPGVNVTPHIAAITNPKTAVEQILSNFQRLQDNQKLSHLVDIALQY